MGWKRTCALFVALGWLGVVAAARADDDNGPLGPSFATVTFASQAPDHAAIAAYFRRPAGTAPVPAVIAFHGCGGITVPLARYFDWADRLVAAGYAVLFPDSFRPRGHANQCRSNIPRSLRVSGPTRSLDELAAAEWLKGRPDIDPAHIASIGWSHGGITTLSLVNRPQAKGLFAGSIAFYPDCRDALLLNGWTPKVPLLILMGESDDWTPAQPCHQLAAQHPEITLVTYPDTYHDFDVPHEKVHVEHHMAGSINSDGSVHVGTNPVSRADAIARAMAFFKDHLGS